jgi:polyisoprenoid-binding protein YceI
MPAPAATETPAPTATPAAVAPVVFQIDPTQSEASFTLDEELFGSPVSVIGLTSDVSGLISVTQGNLGQTIIGPIRINARDLHTDEEMRNRAIRTFILQSSDDAYQYITFEPTQIEGLPAEAKTGETVMFKVTGNLKIRDIVKPATFDVTVTAKSEAELTGSATTVVKRSDFDLNIPSVPGVANVSDNVALAFTFVAKRQ